MNNKLKEYMRRNSKLVNGVRIAVIPTRAVFLQERQYEAYKGLQALDDMIEPSQFDYIRTHIMVDGELQDVVIAVMSEKQQAICSMKQLLNSGD